eukprot:SAG11_NODE_2956_length_2812_cov_2.043126_2_plen_126_part_00
MIIAGCFALVFEVVLLAPILVNYRLISLVSIGIPEEIEEGLQEKMTVVPEFEKIRPLFVLPIFIIIMAQMVLWSCTVCISPMREERAAITAEKNGQKGLRIHEKHLPQLPQLRHLNSNVVEVLKF